MTRIIDRITEEGRVNEIGAEAVRCIFGPVFSLVEPLQNKDLISSRVALSLPL